MKYSRVKNPQWGNAAKTFINCDVDFDDLIDEFVPFTAAANDHHEHTREIFALCVAGEFGEVADYVPPRDVHGEVALDAVRAKRNQILATVVDPVVSNPLRWAEMGTEQQQAWADYRRALLDITTVYPNPSYVWSEEHQTYEEVGIVWPVKPT